MRVGQLASVVLVSLYLLGVGAWLILTRQISPPGFLRIIRAAMRPKYAGTLTRFIAEQGYCYLASLPPHLLSDRESASFMEVFEDGRPLGPGHAPHEDVRRLGQGRFSHWGDRLYFSTSDNSDPRTNGRHYTVKEVRR